MLKYSYFHENTKLEVNKLFIDSVETIEAMDDLSNANWNYF